MATATAIRSDTRLHQAGTAAAIVTGVALLVKVALIIATANAISPSVTGALYITGVALPLVAAAGIASGRDGWLTRVATFVGVVVAHLAFITMLSDGVGALVEAFSNEAYLIDEVPVAVLGLIWLITGLRMRAGARA